MNRYEGFESSVLPTLSLSSSGAGYKDRDRISIQRVYDVTHFDSSDIPVSHDSIGSIFCSSKISQT